MSPALSSPVSAGRKHGPLPAMRYVSGESPPEIWGTEKSVDGIGKVAPSSIVVDGEGRGRGGDRLLIGLRLERGDEIKWGGGDANWRRPWQPWPGGRPKGDAFSLKSGEEGYLSGEKLD